MLPAPRTSPPPSSPQKVHGVEEEEEGGGDQDEPAPTTKPVQTTTSQPSSVATTTAQGGAVVGASTSSSKMTHPTPLPKPVPIRPKSLLAQQKQVTPDNMDIDIMSADDGVLGDELVGGTAATAVAAATAEAEAERDPESEEIVKQLEKGLPRWPGFGEFGWMEEGDVSLVCLLYFTFSFPKPKKKETDGTFLI